MSFISRRPREFRFSSHALQRISERGIRRRWVRAAVGTQPTRHGRHTIFVLTAKQLGHRFGDSFTDGVRVVVDQGRALIVTVHWLSRG